MRWCIIYGIKQTRKESWLLLRIETMGPGRSSPRVREPRTQQARFHLSQTGSRCRDGDGWLPAVLDDSAAIAFVAIGLVAQVEHVAKPPQRLDLD